MDKNTIKAQRVGIKGGPYFDPLEDITAWELAQIVDLLMRAAAGASDVYEFWQSLPENVQRHFVSKGEER